VFKGIFIIVSWQRIAKALVRVTPNLQILLAHTGPGINYD